MTRAESGRAGVDGPVGRRPAPGDARTTYARAESSRNSQRGEVFSRRGRAEMVSPTARAFCVTERPCRGAVAVRSPLTNAPRSTLAAGLRPRKALDSKLAGVMARRSKANPLLHSTYRRSPGRESSVSMRRQTGATNAPPKHLSPVSQSPRPPPPIANPARSAPERRTATAGPLPQDDVSRRDMGRLRRTTKIRTTGKKSAEEFSISDDGELRTTDYGVRRFLLVRPTSKKFTPFETQRRRPQGSPDKVVPRRQLQTKSGGTTTSALRTRSMFTKPHLSDPESARGDQGLRIALPKPWSIEEFRWVPESLAVHFPLQQPAPALRTGSPFDAAPGGRKTV